MISKSYSDDICIITCIEQTSAVTVTFLSHILTKTLTSITETLEKDRPRTDGDSSNLPDDYGRRIAMK